MILELSQSTLELPRRQISEKTVKKAVFGHFLKNFDKKSRFFGARSPSKLVYIGAEGAFRKILGSVGQKWIYGQSIMVNQKVSAAFLYFLYLLQFKPTLQLWLGL